MIKDNQLINITITPSVYEWYIKLGYEVKIWDKIQVPPIDLPITSHHKVVVICDECGEEKTIQYRYYCQHIKRFGNMYRCNKCINKADETNIKRQVSLKHTLINKYGVENPIQIPGVT